MSFEQYFTWFITGLITLLFVVVWYATREWINGIKNGFIKVNEKFDELIHAIDKIDVLSQVQNERISNLMVQMLKHEQRIESNTNRISVLENKQSSTKKEVRKEN